MTKSSMLSRRQFLKFVSSSPLLAYMGMSDTLAENILDPDLRHLLLQERDIISSPELAVNIFDFEAVARKKLPPAHYGYIATGVTDERTQVANREGFKKIQLRMRRLIDVGKIDMSTELFDKKWPSPIGLAPVGSQKAFHPKAEIAVAKAARNLNHLQILSTVANTSVEDVNRARGEPVWYQLYTMPNWMDTLSIVRRAEAAGCTVLVITVDLATSENRETLRTFRQLDERECKACHDPSLPSRKPAISTIDFKNISTGEKDARDWNLIDRIRQSTKMKIVLKGIVTAEDARLCVANGLDGIIVSNHGGRAAPTGRSAIECLPEVIAAVDGKIPVMMDSGIRRGTDVFKALALGAKKIFIGRPYIWGLAAFGQAGVEGVLNILNAELRLTMQQAGTTSLNELRSDHLAKTGTTAQ